MKEEYQEYRNDLEKFEIMTEQFIRKEVTVPQYKGFSGRYGSYAQRGGEKSMLRFRMNGGQITKDKLKYVVDCIEKEGIDKIHFTTCQTVQLHNLKPESVGRMMIGAIDYGIITWGGGGDYPRNVMVSPLSGVEQGEYFDVMPCAQATVDYLLKFIDRIKLPRKLKVGYSNSPINETHVTFRDLGFAAQENGTFQVYSAGGLGNNPKMGVLVGENVEPSKVLYYVKAMLETFVAYGDYENRGKARTRYMQDKLGVEGYRQAFLEKLHRVMESGEDLKLKQSGVSFTKRGDGSKAEHERVISQKQEGLYAVSYHPVGGTPSVDLMRKLYETIAAMDQVELRLTPDQGLYMINCTGTEAQKVLEVTEDGACSPFESSVACIGSSVCQVGVRDSQKLIHTLVEEMRAQGIRNNALPQIHISGCPSSCGTHQIGRIGFHGGVKMMDKVAHAAFTLHLNGMDAQGEERFGKKLGVILEEDIPAFLAQVGKTVEQSGMDFEQWLDGNIEQFESIANQYLK